MNIIIRKVKLVAAPEPPFIGTRIGILVETAGDNWGIQTGALANGCSSVRIDWGDGTRETRTSLAKTSHTYEKAGAYVVKISDDIRYFGIGANDGKEPYATTYPDMMRSLASNGTRLNKLTTYAFARATHLTAFDLRETALTRLATGAFADCTALTTLSGLPNGLTELMPLVFSGCSSLSGSVYLRGVTTLLGTADTSSFLGTNVRMFHFAATNEAAIRASALYKSSPDLGVPGATVVFDL